MTQDLADAALAPQLPGRPLRSYPAVVSTEADALAWARAGAPRGAVVVADYQAAPRGRGGRVWDSRPGHGLGFSLVLRPDLPAEREGWLYLPVLLAISEVVADDCDTPIRWPDEVHGPDGRLAALTVATQLDVDLVAFAVATIMIEEATPPRGALLADLLTAIDERLTGEPQAVGEEYTRRCDTVGRHVRARLTPLGPRSVEISGRAVGCRSDGALAIATEDGRTAAVPPGALGRLEVAMAP